MSKQNPESGEKQAKRDNLTENVEQIPAIRHVGPRLESHPEYYAIVSPGHSTAEAQIAAEAGPIDVDQRRMEEDDFSILFPVVRLRIGRNL